jgi:putative proteasome-type protease
MTFCLGIRTREGLVAIADTRLTTGHEVMTARKLLSYTGKNHAMFLMTSGLRSIRDKTLTYFDEIMRQEEMPFDRLYKAANAFAQQLRIVAKEDKEHLEDSGFHFDMHCLMGGQMRGDPEPKLYLIYPQGNWVEIGIGSPYYIIGSSTYGKPVLDRTLDFEDPMRIALKIGCLAFDSTRISAADVDFPVDIALYRGGTFQIIEQRFTQRDLREVTGMWQERLRVAMETLEITPFNPLLARLPAAGQRVAGARTATRAKPATPEKLSRKKENPRAKAVQEAAAEIPKPRRSNTPKKSA